MLLKNNNILYHFFQVLIELGRILACKKLLKLTFFWIYFPNIKIAEVILSYENRCITLI